MKWKYIVSLGFINFVYLLVGGCIFHLIEYPEEERKNKFALDNYASLKSTGFIGNITCLSKDELQDLVENIVKQNKEGKILQVKSTADWTLPKSIFFATTVITTIGYGNTALATTPGKIFCLFYAFFGIPLCLTLLGGIGKRLNKAGQVLDSKLNRGIFSANVGRIIRVLLLFAIGFFLFLLLPACIFTFMEGWEYGIAIYYGFITLTTVGFGDYVAGQNEDKSYGWIYNISLAMWIMIGLAWAAAMIANVQELYKGLVHAEEDEDVTSNVNTNSVKEDIPLVKNAAPFTKYTPTLEPTNTNP